MRILIVTETFIPSIDGVVTRLRYLVDYLAARGHDVRIVAPHLGHVVYPAAGGHSVPIYGAPTFTAPFYPSRPFSLPWPAWPRIRRLVDEFQPHIIHAVQPIMLAQTAVWAARSYRIPLIASYHTNLPEYVTRYRAWSWSAPLIDTLTRRLHAHAALTVATSHAMGRVLQQRGIGPVRIIPRGVDHHLFHPDHADTAMRTRMLGGAAHHARVQPGDHASLLLVFVGRIAAEKELESLGPLLRAHPDVALAVIGEGPHEAHVRRALEGTRTTFMGPLQGADLARAYASADAFVFPSVTETLGLVLTEAMACALPVIAASSAPTEEQVVHGVNGVLYCRTHPRREHREFEAALTLLRDPTTRASMGANARSVALKYSWEAASEALEAAYLDVLNAPSYSQPSARQPR